MLDARFRLELIACDVTVFKSLRFHLSTLETERFRNDAFSNVSTLKSSFESMRFHLKTHQFSSVLMWTEGQNASKRVRFHLKKD